MRRQDVTSSVSPPDPSRTPVGSDSGAPEGPDTGPVGPPAGGASTPARPANPADQPPDTSGDPPATAPSPAPRWLVILAWSTGPAALYALASLAHAALVEGILSVDVGFGRSLAFWVGTIYLALLAWGFLPRRPDAWYAHRRPVVALLALGLIGTIVCGALTVLWLRAHWVPCIGVPVTVSIVVLLVAAVGVLWLAGRDDRPRGAGF